VTAGLSDDRHPHELRHSVASYLSVVLGMPLEQVADVLGHAGIGTLLAVYRQVDVSPSVRGHSGWERSSPCVRPLVTEGATLQDPEAICPLGERSS
jgi:hypothetical protein